MKVYLFLIPVLVLVLLQGSFLPWNLILFLILFRAALKPNQQTFYLAFWSGLLLDLGRGGPLGLSSIIFLVGSFLLLFYSRKFDPFHFIFLTIFVFLINLFSEKIIVGVWGWQKSLVLALLTFIATFWWQKWLRRD